MTPAAIRLETLLKPRVWGGDRMSGFGRGVAPGDRIGEAWELADLPASVEGGRSRISAGPGAGSTLREFITAEPDFVLGRDRGAGDRSAEAEAIGFPLLIKFLDAREDLSVQVHPTPAYAADHRSARVKTEAWFVVAADPGARILAGLQRPLSPDELRRAAADGSIVDHLISHPVSPGQCFFLPSGTCHALGRGVLVAEVQSASDTTFRLFDWGRSERELHLDQAVEVMTHPSAPLGPPPPTSVERTDVLGPDGLHQLVRSDAFDLDGLAADTPRTLERTTHEKPEVVMVTAGSAVIDDGVAPFRLDAGRTILIPAALPAYRVEAEAGARLLFVRLSDPDRRHAPDSASPSSASVPPPAR